MQNLKFKILKTSFLALVIILAVGCGTDDVENEGNHLPDVNIVQSDKIVNVGTEVTLTSTALDIDGDDLTYQWSFVSKPTDSTAQLSTDTTKETSFVADKEGEYKVKFVSKDAVDAEGSDVITITAKKVGNDFSQNIISCENYEEISGGYSVDTTLDGCYKVTSGISIAKNKLLTIKAGTTLVFSNSARLEVYGALKAVGTPAQPILFTGETKSAGYWQNITFNSLDSRNELDNVIIEYAGGNQYGALVTWGAAKLKISNTIIRENKLYGFNFSEETEITKFDNVTSTKNEYTAGILSPNVLAVIDGTSDFTGNIGDDYITVRNGAVTKDQIWHKLSVPLFIDSLSVADNKFLTIESGSKLVFANGGRFEVYGALKAVGTTEEPITFTGATASAGYWQNITFNSIDNKNELDNVIIEYAGSNQYGALVTWGAAKLKISNTIIRENKLYGFNFSEETEITKFDNVTSTKNEYTAGILSPDILALIDGTSDFTGNIGDDYITVRNGAVTKDQVWHKVNVPLFIDSLSVADNKFLTIEAGSKLVFADGGRFEVYGALKAVGTAEEPITFTGATASAGYWQNVTFNSVDNRNELGNVLIEYAGSNQFGALVLWNSAVVKVYDSTIKDNKLYGIWKDTDAQLTSSNNTFTNNEKGDIYNRP